MPRCVLNIAPGEDTPGDLMMKVAELIGGVAPSAAELRSRGLVGIGNASRRRAVLIMDLMFSVLVHSSWRPSRPLV